jgi:hypothetical protein
MMQENSDSTAIVPRPVRSSEEAVRRRQEEILRIKDDLASQGIIADNQIIREELWKRGYYVKRSTVYNDMMEINRLNAFVYDIAKANYGRMIEFCFENLEKTIRHCDEIYDRQWSNSKRVRKRITGDGEDGGDKLIEEHHEGAELAGPKLKAEDIRVKAIKLMLDALSGGLLDVAANLLHKEFMRMKVIKDQLEQKVNQQSAELAELKREEAIAKKTSAGV